EVGRENDELLEGYLNLLATRQAEVIDPVFQGDDPPVEQGRRIDPLPAEVVDQQATAIAFELQRRLAHIGYRVVLELEAVHGELAPHHHRWPGDPHPAAIDVGGAEQALARRTDFAMARRIEQLDNPPVLHYRVGNENVLAKAASNPLSDGRLAVAGRPV